MVDSLDSRHLVKQHGPITIDSEPPVKPTKPRVGRHPTKHSISISLCFSQESCEAWAARLVGKSNCVCPGPAGVPYSAVPARLPRQLELRPEGVHRLPPAPPRHRLEHPAQAQLHTPNTPGFYTIPRVLKSGYI